MGASSSAWTGASTYEPACARMIVQRVDGRVDICASMCACGRAARGRAGAQTHSPACARVTVERVDGRINICASTCACNCAARGSVSICASVCACERAARGRSRNVLACARATVQRVNQRVTTCASVCACDRAVRGRARQHMCQRVGVWSCSAWAGASTYVPACARVTERVRV